MGARVRGGLGRGNGKKPAEGARGKSARKILEACKRPQLVINVSCVISPFNIIKSRGACGECTCQSCTTSRNRWFLWVGTMPAFLRIYRNVPECTRMYPNVPRMYLRMYLLYSAHDAWCSIFCPAMHRLRCSSAPWRPPEISCTLPGVL